VGLGEGDPNIGLSYYVILHFITCNILTRDASRGQSQSRPIIMEHVDAIAQVLTSTLNPDASIRISAELNLSELLKNPRKPVLSYF